MAYKHYNGLNAYRKSKNRDYVAMQNITWDNGPKINRSYDRHDLRDNYRKMNKNAKNLDSSSYGDSHPVRSEEALKRAEEKFNEKQKANRKQKANHKYISKVKTKSGKWRYIYDTVTKSIKSKTSEVGKAANNLKDRVHSTGVRWIAKMKR